MCACVYEAVFALVGESSRHTKNKTLCLANCRHCSSSSENNISRRTCEDLDFFKICFLLLGTLFFFSILVLKPYLYLSGNVVVFTQRLDFDLKNIDCLSVSLNPLICPMSTDCRQDTYRFPTNLVRLRCAFVINIWFLLWIILRHLLFTVYVTQLNFT